jgi:hypothetical protein
VPRGSTLLDLIPNVTPAPWLGPAGHRQPAGSDSASAALRTLNPLTIPHSPEHLSEMAGPRVLEP